MTSASPPDSSAASPSDASTSIVDRLRRLFVHGPADGRLAPTVNVARALELMQDGAQMLDVRENNEWKGGHAPAAVHVALGNLDAAPRRLRKDRPVVVVCASGMRSRTAAKRLRELGFDATSLSGGMSMWERAGGEVRR